MKLIFCDKDKQLIPLSEDLKACECGRIAGKYNKDGLSAVIYLNSMRGCRILAIDSNLITGQVERSVDYVFDWENSGLEVWYKGIKIKDTPEWYAEKNATVFIDNAIKCLASNKKYVKITSELKQNIRKIKKEYKNALKRLPRKKKPGSLKSQG